jgi:hypothetical protein
MVHGLISKASRKLEKIDHAVANVDMPTYSNRECGLHQ